MSDPLTEQPVRCPYCDELQTILVDTSAGAQAYIEDCQVCCRPMSIAFSVDDGELVELRVVADD